jgi:hypothetical protein
LDYDQPWIVFKAKEFLDGILKSDMTVWEYGSGSSTLYFARRVKQVYSVENDKEWFVHLNNRIEIEQMKNVHYRLIETEEANKEDLNSIYISAFKKGEFLKNYATSINIIPDNSLDIVLIDGRARRACIAHAMSKVKQGGYLIVDNSDRSYYFINPNEILFDITKWNSKHFIGPVPYGFHFGKTSFFKKVYKL